MQSQSFASRLLVNHLIKSTGIEHRFLSTLGPSWSLLRDQCMLLQDQCVSGAHTDPEEGLKKVAMSTKRCAQCPHNCTMRTISFQIHWAFSVYLRITAPLIVACSSVSRRAYKSVQRTSAWYMLDWWAHALAFTHTWAYACEKTNTYLPRQCKSIWIKRRHKLVTATSV